MTTNYEKIKNMTVEEMAKFLADFPEQSCTLCGKWNKGCYLECDKYIKQWLQLESEEE